MKLTIVIFLSIQLPFILFAQNDDNWLVKNSKGKLSGGSYYSSLSLTSSQFELYNVSPPGSSNSDGIPRNDIFVIWNGGDMYCSRNESSWNWSSNIFSCFSSSINYTPEYLYFSKIYETDDPPSYSVSNTSISSFSSINPMISIFPRPMMTNQDLVRAEDVTLIIPWSLFDTCNSIFTNPNINLEFSAPLIDGSQSPVLKLNPVFGSPAEWSYHPLMLTQNYYYGGNYIKSINDITPPPPGKLFHFINFNNSFEYNEALIGQQINFTATCAQNPEKSWSISESIRDLHDPNKIEVKCIWRKKKCFLSNTYRYFVKYFVQFYNDGNQNVPWVNIILNMPTYAILNTAELGNWKFGNTTGCGEIDEQFEIIRNYPNILTFILSNNSHPAFLTSQPAGLTPSPSQFGSFEFCIEFAQDPSIDSTNLRPSTPISSFAGVDFPIYHFNDLITRKEYHPNNMQIKRPWSSNCNCKCTYTNNYQNQD